MDSENVKLVNNKIFLLLKYMCVEEPHVLIILAERIDGKELYKLGIISKRRTAVSLEPVLVDNVFTSLNK